MSVRKLGNLGNIKEISIRKKGDNPRVFHMYWGGHCRLKESGKSLSCTVWGLL